jgi:hypothetical protein
MGDGVSPSWDSLSNQADVVKQAIQQYPILGQQELNSVHTDTPGKYGDIESWPPGETGEKGYERPQGLPLNSFGVQVFNGGKTKPTDVLADVVSHRMINTDPTIKKSYQNFKESLTDYQKEKLQRDYEYAKQNDHETRPFNQWAELSRLPAYYRGYTFDQWPENWNRNFYSPEQIKNLDQVRQYLGVTGTPMQADYGRQENWAPQITGK